jgi:hypothetical protein
MSYVTDLIDCYIQAWNEGDAERRRNLIARTWTPDARYIDPLLEGEGHGGIDGMIESVQARFPDHRFRRTSEVEEHHDRLRFTWELAPADGPAMVKGTDIGILADGRLQAMIGFFDQPPPGTGQ